MQIGEIERVIGCGQVEQLIEQAKGELILIPEYAGWKVWEAKPAHPDDEDFAVSLVRTPTHPPLIRVCWGSWRNFASLVLSMRRGGGAC